RTPQKPVARRHNFREAVPSTGPRGHYSAEVVALAGPGGHYLPEVVASHASWLGVDEAGADGEEGGLGAVLHAQLGQDRAHVGLHRLLGEAEFAGDLAVGAA